MNFITFKVTLALLILILSTPSNADPVEVIVGEVTYSITTVEGRAVDLLPQLMEQEWWGLPLGDDLAEALAGGLGFPNSPGAPASPAFAVNYIMDSNTIFTRVCYEQLQPNCSGGFNPPATDTIVFAIAAEDEVAVSVHVPIPIWSLLMLAMILSGTAIVIRQFRLK